MKRASALVVGLVAIAMPAASADLGGSTIPPIKSAIEAPLRPSIWSGCFAEVNASGHFSRTDSTSESLSAGGLGIGCDHQLSSVVVGGRVGYDVGKGDYRGLDVGGRVGWALNPYLLAYGKLGLTLDGRSPNAANSVLTGGIGVETWIGSTVTIFLEADRDLLKFGVAQEITDMFSVRGGARVRF